jgi:hypothetical protein
MKKITLIVFVIFLSSFLASVAQNKPVSVYLGSQYSAMRDSNTYFGAMLGLQAAIRNKNFVSLEGGFIDNTSTSWSGPWGENVVVNRSHVEMGYARQMLESKNGSFILLLQGGFQMQHILYHGKYLYTRSGGWVGNPTPVFETSQYWQPAIPIRIKGIIMNRFIGCGIDLFADLSRNSDFGVRVILYAGKLKE